MSSYHNTVELYNITAKGYDELYRDEQYSKYSYVFEKGFVSRGTVIDVGCGTGLLYEYIVSNGYSFDKYICIEPSYSMLTIAMKKFHHDPRVIGFIGLGEFIGLRSSIADSVYSFTVWDNVPINYRKKFLNEIIKLIKCNGYIVLSFIKHGWKDKLRYIESIIIENNHDIRFLGCNRYDCFLVIWK